MNYIITEHIDTWVERNSTYELRSMPYVNVSIEVCIYPEMRQSLINTHTHQKRYTMHLLLDVYFRNCRYWKKFHEIKTILNSA